MPEEINRILTDELSDICFVTEKSGIKNLKNIGKTETQIEFVGNTLIDTLVHFTNEIEDSLILEEIQQEKNQYILVTMHIPRNVDSRESLLKIINLFEMLVKKKNVVFSIHARTQQSFMKFRLYKTLNQIQNLIIIAPQKYFSFQKLIKYSFCVITDSGGIQEETTFQQIPCITLRENTERPSTIIEVTNQLMSFDKERILKVINDINEGKIKKGSIPKFWDGNATERIIKKIIEYLS